MGGLAGAGADAFGAQQAEGAALQGFNYGTTSPLATNYGPTGAAANNVLTQLLGNSPLTPQAASGFNNYLNQAGFGTALANSNMGVVNQAAANGTYNSGGTIRALDQNATGLASQYATNYTNYLQSLSNSGQQAYNSVTAAGTGGGAAAANAGEQAANAAGQAAGGAVNGGLGLLGLVV